MNTWMSFPVKKQMAAALLLLVFAQFFSIIGTVWSRIPGLVGVSFPGLNNDFLHGFFIGIGIVLNVFAIVLLLTTAKRRMGRLPGEGLGLM